MLRAMSSRPAGTATASHSSTTADPSSAGAGRLREGGDRCPGATRLHEAADGALARVRIPGGLLDVQQAEAIAAASRKLGDGAIHLTSRGNIELRGLPLEAGADLADRLHAAGLLPSVVHERARNVVASPLSGLDAAGLLAGQGDVQRWVRELDRLLCADQRLTQLSGRFLFGFDDGRGDILSLAPDVTVVAVSPERAEVVLNGSPIGVTVPAALAARAAIVVAHTFLDRTAAGSGDAWRLADLSAADRTTLATGVRECLLNGAAGGSVISYSVTSDPAGNDPVANDPVNNTADGPVRPDAAGAPRLGYVLGPDGSAALSVGAPLGRVSLTAWNALVRTTIRGGRTLRLTPWRGVVLPGFAVADAAGALAGLSDCGLLTEPESPWVGATACVGRPGCAKALADVHDDARRALVAPAMATVPMTTCATAGTAVEGAGIPPLAVHWSGCERRCGHPIGAHVDVVATDAGYRIGTSGRQPVEVTNSEMAQAVSAARSAM